MDMSFVYSIAQEKKVPWENLKKIVAIVSIPIKIGGGPYVKALQGSIALINYLCTIDNVWKLSDDLFDFRGPVIISDVSDVLFNNIYFDPQRNIIPTPVKESSYSSNDQSALNRFLDIKTIVTSQIKNSKEPIK